MALSNGQIIVGAGLLGGAAFFYFNPRAFTSMLETFGMDEGQADALTQQVGLPLAPRPTRPRMPAGGAVGSGAAAGAVAGPIGAGIGAAAGFIAWGITDQGWFRGGWEGVRGNTIRDKFLDQFIQVFYPGAGVDMQYEAMVKALENIGIVGQPASDMISRLYAADDASAMQSAIAAWAAAFRARGITIVVPPDSEY